MAGKNDLDQVPVLKTTDLLVLIVLLDGPQHGYGLAQALDRRTAGRITVRPGDLYRVLYRMHQQRLIEPVRAPARGSDERRAHYGITPLGRRAARLQAEMLTALCAPVLTGRPRSESAP